MFTKEELGKIHTALGMLLTASARPDNPQIDLVELRQKVVEVSQSSSAEGAASILKGSHPRSFMRIEEKRSYGWGPLEEGPEFDNSQDGYNELLRLFATSYNQGAYRPVMVHEVVTPLDIPADKLIGPEQAVWQFDYFVALYQGLVDHCAKTNRPAPQLRDQMGDGIVITFGQRSLIRQHRGGVVQWCDGPDGGGRVGGYAASQTIVRDWLGWLLGGPIPKLVPVQPQPITT